MDSGSRPPCGNEWQVRIRVHHNEATVADPILMATCTIMSFPAKSLDASRTQNSQEKIPPLSSSIHGMRVDKLRVCQCTGPCVLWKATFCVSREGLCCFGLCLSLERHQAAMCSALSLSVSSRMHLQADLRALTDVDVWGCRWRAKLWSSNC
jgi:hypothetical protein